MHVYRAGGRLSYQHLVQYSVLSLTWGLAFQVSSVSPNASSAFASTAIEISPRGPRSRVQTSV